MWQCVKAALWAAELVLGPAPKCGRRQVKMATFRLFSKPTQLPTAPHYWARPEALLPQATALLDLSLVFQTFLLSVLYELLFFCSPPELCCAPQALPPSALFSLRSTFSPWEKSPTFIYTMPRPKSLSLNRFLSWAPTASWPSIPRQPTSVTSSVCPEVLPHHHTRLS